MKGCDKEFLVEAERLDVKDKGPLILAELLLDEQVLTQLKQHQYHFLRVGSRSHLPACTYHNSACHKQFNPLKLLLMAFRVMLDFY